MKISDNAPVHFAVVTTYSEHFLTERNANFKLESDLGRLILDLMSTYLFTYFQT
jgi:hypothetical protein